MAVKRVQEPDYPTNIGEVHNLDAFKDFVDQGFEDFDGSTPSYFATPTPIAIVQSTAQNVRQTIVDVAHNETNMPALQSPAQLAATERITVNASQTPLMTLDEETYMVPLTLPQGQRLVPVAWTIQQLDGTQSEQSLPRLFIKHHDGTSFLELTVSSDHSQQEFGLDGSRNLAATIHSAPGTIAPSLMAAQLDGHFASQISQKQIWNQGSEALSQRSAIAFLPSLKESVERAHALSPIRHSIPSQSSNQAGTLPNSPLFHHEDASHLGSKPSSQISTRQSFNLSAQYASNGTMHPRSSDRGHDGQNLTSEQLHGIQRLTTVDDVFHTSYLPTKSSEFEPETVKQSIGTYSPVAASRISFDNFDQVRSGLFPDHDLSIESLFPELNGRFFPQTAQEAWCGDAQISRSSHETVDQNLHQVPANTKSASRGKLRKDSSRSLTKDSSKIRLLASPNTGGVSQQRRRLFDQKTLEECVKNEAGEVQGIMTTFGSRQRLRSALPSDQRRLTGQCRERGACERCRKLKKRCRQGPSMYEPCATCSTSSPRTLMMPCVQVKIIEAALFRLKPPVNDPNHPMNFWVNKEQLLSHNHLARLINTVQLVQDVGSTEKPITLTVLVSRFDAHSEDRTGYKWQDKNGDHVFEMPPFLISDVEGTQKRILQYASESTPYYLANLLDKSNPIIWSTFQLALRCKSTIVQDSLTLWSSSRFIERTWRLFGENTLGLSPVHDPLNPWNGIIPVTPIMDQQLDQIVIHTILVPLQNGLLRGLEKKVYGRKREDWFEIYLTIFILMSNTEWQLAHERQFAQRYGMSGRFGNYGKYANSELHFHAAKTMLAYFHYVSCGSTPLNLDFTSPNTARLAALNAEQIQYLGNLKKEINVKGNIDIHLEPLPWLLTLQIEFYMLSLRAKHKYETDLYWCHQMFFPNWQPGNGHIQELRGND